MSPEASEAKTTAADPAAGSLGPRIQAQTVGLPRARVSRSSEGATSRGHLSDIKEVPEQSKQTRDFQTQASRE